MLSVAPEDGPDGRLQFHASTVAIEGRAVMLLGPSGTGKSNLALGLMSLGAGLIGDDITWIEGAGGQPMAQCPPSISGQIEAWGVGLLDVKPVAPAPLCLIVDLGQLEEDRMPPDRAVEVMSAHIPVLHKVETPHFAAIIMRYILQDRVQRYGL